MAIRSLSPRVQPNDKDCLHPIIYAITFYFLPTKAMITLIKQKAITRLDKSLVTRINTKKNGYIFLFSPNRFLGE